MSTVTALSALVVSRDRDKKGRKGEGDWSICDLLFIVSSKVVFLCSAKRLKNLSNTLDPPDGDWALAAWGPEEDFRSSLA